MPARTLLGRELVRFGVEKIDALLKRRQVPLRFEFDGDWTLETLGLEGLEHVGGFALASAPHHVVHAVGAAAGREVLEMRRQHFFAVAPLRRAHLLLVEEAAGAVGQHLERGVADGGPLLRIDIGVRALELLPTHSSTEGNTPPIYTP